MKIGLLGGILAGALITGMVVENSSPGSTAPASENTRTAASNWMVTLGGMVSDGVHVVVPVAADAVNTARDNFPSLLGPTATTTPTDGTGTAQHPPAAQP